MIGRIVAQYEILKEIGRGGMGVVYLAKDMHLQCQRALKFLSPHLAEHPRDLSRLIAEARSLAALEHPNICPVHEIGDCDGLPFIVMSFLEGQTLKELLEEGPLPLDCALDIAEQVAAGLGAAHLKGFIHRDIKPENIMLTRNDDISCRGPRVILMDFGITLPPDSTQLTLPGRVLGTIAYMSPEQIRGEDVDPRADIWSLGVVLYEMATGHRPFGGDHPAAILNGILNGTPDFKGIESPGLQNIIRKALKKNRVERYAEVSELFADLNRVRTGSKIKVKRQASRRRLITGGILLLAILGSLIGSRFIPTGERMPTALAVMPLEDRSQAEDPFRFSEGVADELVRSLSKIGSLTVISARSAAEARKVFGSNREISRHLGVDCLVEGSVQRIGNRTRVSLQLVDCDNDRLIWSETFIREISDIFALENEIALAVAAALEAQLTVQEKEKLQANPVVVPAAFEAYLLGRQHLGRTTALDLEQGIAEFERAIALDPEFAEPHTGIASALVLLRQMKSLPPDSVYAEIKHHLHRALELDPDLAEGYEGLANAAIYFDLDLKAAGTLFAKARTMDPNRGMMGYAQYLNSMGRHEEALHEALRAVARDPLDPFLRGNLAARYHYAGRDEEAISVLDDLVSREPDFWLSYWVRSFIQFGEGDFKGAARSLERAAALDSSFVVLPDLAFAYLNSGRHEAAMAIDERFRRLAEEGYVPPIYLGVLHAAFRRYDEAFASLELALDERDMYLPWIQLGFPALRNLAGDPRWNELVTRIGLPPSD
ncbi:protein kinase [bacterium]|nr:protein kinase [bacterium]